MEKLLKQHGWFDVRTYNAALPREQWQIKNDNENIVFMIRSTEQLNAPAGISEFAKEVTKADGTILWFYRLKIGKGTHWYNEKAQPIARPANADLDGKRYEVNVTMTIKPKDPAQPTKPCGLWVNHIMITELEDNPFAEFASNDEDLVDAASEETTTPATTPGTTNNNDNTELPF